MTETRYLELLEAAPAIKRDELTRVQEFQPRPNEIAVSVYVAMARARAADWHKNAPASYLEDRP